MKIKKKKNIKLTAFDTVNHLSEDMVYDVLSIEDNYYRLFDNLGEPVLFPAYAFDIIDNTIDLDWILIRDNDKNIEYYGPSELSDRYFFEDYFNGDKIYLEKLLTYILNKNMRIACNIESLKNYNEEKKR